MHGIKDILRVVDMSSPLFTQQGTLIFEYYVQVLFGRNQKPVTSTKHFVCVCVGGGGGGGGGREGVKGKGNFGVIVVQVCESQYFETYPFHIPGL